MNFTRTELQMHVPQGLGGAKGLGDAADGKCRPRLLLR
jgi:hypothetical protein